MPDRGVIGTRPTTGAMLAAPERVNGSPRFRKSFTLEQTSSQVASAKLFLSALGVVEGWLNGRQVNSELLTPGWTAFEWRVRFTQTDVTSLLCDGENVLGLQAGDGWYATPLFIEPHVRYGDSPCVFAELHITYLDGRAQLIATDRTWEASAGPVLASNLYNGQSIDGRLAGTQWAAPGFDQDHWQAARLVEFDNARLEPQFGPPVKRQEVLQPEQIWLSPSGKTLVDFGQNIVGWIRVRVTGDHGEQVSIRHAEVLENGELGTRPLRSAKATDTYILSGGVDLFEPTLVFHGFRFAEIDGWPGGIEQLRSNGGLEAVVVGSDIRRIGHFRCSNQQLNQLHANVVWSTKGNFLAVPTDCPQRDERLGWTGDISVFAPTAAFLFDVKDFLREWLRDAMIEQAHNDGIVPWVVPDILKHFPQFAELTADSLIDKEGKSRFNGAETVAIWSDSIVWVPWALWIAYGDKQVLEETCNAQIAHVRRALLLLSDRGVWEGSFQFGDWLDPDAPPHAPIQAKADPDVVATLSLYRSLCIVAEVGKILGRSDFGEFDQAAEELKRAFYECYVRGKRIESDCTTVYALAICFDILDLQDLQFAGDRLVDLVRAAGHRINTGFAGTPFICDALAKTGYLEDAYRMLLQTEQPSWLYPVSMGATTVWERYDSMLPDGSINPGSMTSFNHYALGAVADWMHRTIGGIEAVSTGNHHYRVAPRPGGAILWADTSLEIVSGTLSVEWRLDDSILVLTADVPPRARVELDIEGHEPLILEPGQQTFRFTLPIQKQSGDSHAVTP